jgi:hypothetical protein
MEEGNIMEGFESVVCVETRLEIKMQVQTLANRNIAPR